MAENAHVMIAEGDLQNKIYTVRGQKVMLDFDLAKIYGYETRYLNRQVLRNKEKFDGEDFMFQLAQEEVNQILMCQNVTSSSEGISMCQNVTSISQNVTSIPRNLISQNVTSSWGGTRKLPYAFTEQGIYMLMTVLKGELATKQSKTLIRLFKAMKDYLLEEQSAVSRIIDHSRDISEIKTEIKEMHAEIEETVKKSEISPVFLDFGKTAETQEFLLLDGQPLKAKEAYMEIYKQAKKEIYIIDNYVDIRTLHLLQIVKKRLKITFFTDNVRGLLRKSDLDDFITERPDLSISFIKSNRKIHDRFIVLDNVTIYQSGGSSKDAGNKMTSIHKISDDFVTKSLLNEIDKLKRNDLLKLKS